jgi:hypothetical protein
MDSGRLTTPLLLVLASGLSLFGTIAAGAQDPSIAERFTQIVSGMQAFPAGLPPLCLDAETVVSTERKGLPESLPNERTSEAQLQGRLPAKERRRVVTRFYFDGGKTDYRATRYEGGLEGSQESLASTSSFCWNGQEYWRTTSRHSEQSRLPNLYCQTKEAGERRTQQSLNAAARNMPMFLRAPIDNRRSLMEILLAATEGHVVAEQEEIEGHSCLLLEAKTSIGSYKVWVDPEADNLPRRILVTVQGTDVLGNGMPVSEAYGHALAWGEVGNVPRKAEFIPCTTVEVLIDGLEIEEAEGCPFVAHWRMTETAAYENGGTRVTVTDSKATNIRLRPDFAEEGAFTLRDIPDGSPVYYHNDPRSGIKFEWRNGEIVPAENSALLHELEVNADIVTEGVALARDDTPRERAVSALKTDETSLPRQELEEDTNHARVMIACGAAVAVVGGGALFGRAKMMKRGE